MLPHLNVLIQIAYTLFQSFESSLTDIVIQTLVDQVIVLTPRHVQPLTFAVLTRKHPRAFCTQWMRHKVQLV